MGLSRPRPWPVRVRRRRRRLDLRRPTSAATAAAGSGSPAAPSLARAAPPALSPHPALGHVGEIFLDAPPRRIAAALAANASAASLAAAAMLAHRRSDPAIGGRLVRRSHLPKPVSAAPLVLSPAASAPVVGAPSGQLVGEGSAPPAACDHVPGDRFELELGAPPDKPASPLEDVPAPPLATSAPLADSSRGQLTKLLAPLLVGACPETQPAASMVNLVLPAEVPVPPPHPASVDELVPVSTIPVQLVQATFDHAFNAPYLVAAATGASPSGSLASSRPPQRVCDQQSLPIVDDATGGAMCDEVPWEIVQSRRSKRRAAFNSPVLKTRPPPPAWLHGRCHRCHEAGHWAASCCEQLRCNNCRQFGHKAKCCTGRTAPRPPPVQDRRAAYAPAVVHPRPCQRSSPCPTRQSQPPRQPADVQLQSVMAEQAELLRSELLGCLARVESFLVRAQVGFGRVPVAPDVSPPSELHVGSVDDEEASLYGCFSPRGMPCPSPQPIVRDASNSEDIVEVMAPVTQIMPELHELCREPASLKVIPVGDVVVASGVLAPVPGALFAKKLCDFLAKLEADDPGSSKTIGCLLKEREIKSKSKEFAFLSHLLSLPCDASRDDWPRAVWSFMYTRL